MGDAFSPAEPPVDLSVELGSIHLEHPLLDASGTYDLLAMAAHYAGDFVRDFPFAAYVPKTVTIDVRLGNPPPRVAETASGMVNAIGLANPGLEVFISTLPALASLRAPVIVSVGGRTTHDYVAVVRRLEEHLATSLPGNAPDIVGYELNVSCPNVRHGGVTIGTDERETASLVAAVRPLTTRFLITKLTPNVTSVVAFALAAVAAGSDGLSLINTLRALVLDPQTLKPFLGNRTGGLSGPAIKPVALRMVSEVAAAVDVPIIGMGGIRTGLDALEFVACGATAVAIGAANFADIAAAEHIRAELAVELAARGYISLEAARGCALA
ncbi:MAG: dihydroorotate dehydrogenase [Thermoleophilia bacterium]